MPGDDDILPRERDLAEARARLTALTHENESLRRRLGPSAGAAPRLPSAASDRAQPGYRGRDRALTLDRDLAEVNTAIAALEIDNAILAARFAAPPKERPARWQAVSVAVIVAFSAGLAFAADNFMLFPVALLLGFLGWGLVSLMDSIKPSGASPRDPPYLPPPGV